MVDETDLGFYFRRFINFNFTSLLLFILENRNKLTQLIIIGNGFDLAHGLPTRYQDFLVWYLNSALKTFKESSRYSSPLFELAWPARATVGLQEEDLKHNKIDDILRVFPNRSIKYQPKGRIYDRITTQNNLNKWVDIESEFYYLLKSAAGSSKSSDQFVSKLNDEMKYIRLKLAEYLNQICAELLLEPNYYNKVNDELFLSAGRRLKNNSLKYLVLDFNYTGIAKKYLQYKDEYFYHFQIHGNMEEPNTIVFGYGDERDKDYERIEELNNNLLFDHIKSFSYLQNNKYSQLFNHLKDEEFEVTIVGHSLGLSDRTLLSQIFDLDKLNSVRVLYHRRVDGTDDFTEKMHQISRHFKDKGRMRLKVMSKDLCKPFPQFSRIQQSRNDN